MIQKKGPGVGFYGKVRIPTIGHAAAIDTAKSIAKKVGGKLHIGLSGTSHPLSSKDKRDHAQRVFKHPVMPEGESTKNIFSFLSHMHKHHDELHLVAGSDRAGEYRTILQKYNNKADKKGNVNFAFKKWTVHEVEGKREESNKDPTKMSHDELKRSVSASKLEKLAKEGKYDHFKAYHPGIDEKHVKHIYNQIRKGIHEEIEIPNVGLTLSRALMPQLSVDGFLSFLKGKNIKAEKKEIDCSKLHSTQSEFDDDKIISMMHTDGEQKPILVSRDNHVLDGHHRWLADHNSGNKTTTAWVIDASILHLLQLSKEYEMLSEEVTHKEFAPMVDQFVSFASKKLGIKEPPKMTYKGELGGEQPSFGGYNPSSKEIVLHTKNRHPMDIFRTLAHELVHHKQNEDGRIKDVAKEGSTGSAIEDEANSMAGRIMRWYAKANPDTFAMKSMVESATFVVGVPCSGKDAIIRKLKETFHMREVDAAALQKSNVVQQSSNLIISAAAENLQSIIEAKNFLEFNGYVTQMVFVEITNDVSQQRNEARKDRGQRVLNESIRLSKFMTGMNNKKELQEIFGGHMLVIDNSQKAIINAAPQKQDLDSKFSKLLEENTPHDREFGTKSLRAIYSSETPGERKKIKKRIVKKKLKEVRLDSPLTPGGIGADGIGPEYSVAKSPSLVYGFANLNESVRKWANNPKTIVRFIDKYGSLAERKLIEAAINLNKLYESPDKGALDTMGTVPKQGKEIEENEKPVIRRIVKKHK